MPQRNSLTGGSVCRNVHLLRYGAAANRDSQITHSFSPSLNHRLPAEENDTNRLIKDYFMPTTEPSVRFTKGTTIRSTGYHPEQ